MPPSTPKGSRAASIAGLRGRYSVLTPAQLAQTLDIAKARIMAALVHPAARLRENAQRIDIAQAEPEEVRGMLLSFGIPPDEMVTCIWFSGLDGITLCYADFVAHYDGLWYPSSDDVLVTGRRCSWFLAIDHEEAITFTRHEQPCLRA